MLHSFYFYSAEILINFRPIPYAREGACMYVCMYVSEKGWPPGRQTSTFQVFFPNHITKIGIVLKRTTQQG